MRLESSPSDKLDYDIGAICRYRYRMAWPHDIVAVNSQLQRVLHARARVKISSDGEVSTGAYNWYGQDCSIACKRREAISTN